MALVCVLMVTCFFGCVNREEGNTTIIQDGKTINVMIRETGFGTSYIYKMKENFERIYADEGYKVNVYAPQADLSEDTVIQKIYMDEGFDVFFTSPNLKDGLAGEYGECFADLTDIVYNQKPIKLDGTEEDCTVLSKLDAIVLAGNTFNGRYYGLPYSYTSTGLGVNVKVLNELKEVYGLDVKIPRTTNELYEVIDEIMSGYTATSIKPFMLGNVDYVEYMLTTWMVQYAGAENIRKFWTMENTDGTPLTSPSEVFSPEFGDGAIEIALEAFYHVCDRTIAGQGSRTYEFKKAQKQFMDGKVAFYPVGDWLYQEERVRSESLLEDVALVRVPVLSEIGTKFFGQGTDYNYSDEKCEEILCAIIDGVDANKNVDTITAEVNSTLSVAVKESDVTTVCERVGYLGVEKAGGAGAVISAKSKVKDIAALFLRMITSEDGASMFAHETYCTMPFNFNALSDVDNSWVHSNYVRVSSQYRKGYERHASGHRASLGQTAWSSFTGEEIDQMVLNEELSLFDSKSYEKINDGSIFAQAAKTLAQNIYSDAVAKLG